MLGCVPLSTYCLYGGSEATNRAPNGVNEIVLRRHISCTNDNHGGFLAEVQAI